MGLCEGLQFCIFDLKRGQQELEKVVEKSREAETIWRIDALRKVLKEVHSLFVMFHGSIRSLLLKDSSGAILRSNLYTFIMNYLSGNSFSSMLIFEDLSSFLASYFYSEPATSTHFIVSPNCQHFKSGVHWIVAAGVMPKLLYQWISSAQPCRSCSYSHTSHINFLFEADFLVGRKLHLPSFRDSLKERATVEMLTVGREAAIEAIVRLLESCCGNAQYYSLLLFQDLLVSTTLSLDDTINLFTYTILRLTPHALSSGQSSRSYLRKGSSGSNSITRSSVGTTAFFSEQHRDILQGGNHGSTLRPLQHDKWSKGKNGFLVNDIWHLTMEA